MAGEAHPGYRFAHPGYACWAIGVGVYFAPNALATLDGLN